MQKLIAKASILFESKFYSVGEELPAHDAKMVDAWLEAGTAVWMTDEDEPEKAKARPATAESGLAGSAVASESEDGEDLVGKVPKTAARKKKA